jgi:hypothetical protein
MRAGFGHDEDPDDERMGAMLDPQVLDEGDETAPDGCWHARRWQKLV